MTVTYHCGLKIFDSKERLHPGLHQCTLRCIPGRKYDGIYIRLMYPSVFL